MTEEDYQAFRAGGEGAAADILKKYLSKDDAEVRTMSMTSVLTPNFLTETFLVILISRGCNRGIKMKSKPSRPTSGRKADVGLQN